MQDADPIATGLATIEMLDEADEAWASYVTAHADPRPLVLAQLEALFDAVSDGTWFRAQYRQHLRELIEAIEDPDTLGRELPRRIVEAAHLCHVPVPVGEPDKPRRIQKAPPSRSYWKAVEETFNWIQNAVDELVSSEPEIHVVFIIDKNGQLIAAAGEVERIDTTSLVSLSGGDPEVVRNLFRDRAVTVRFDEDDSPDAAHLELVDERMLLVVIMDAQLDPRRLRRRTGRAADTLLQCVAGLLELVKDVNTETPFAKMTEEDMGYLFSD